MNGTVYEVIKYLPPINCESGDMVNPNLVWEPFRLPDSFVNAMFSYSVDSLQSAQKEIADLEAEGYTAIKIIREGDNAFKGFVTKSEILKN